ncbi:hypothetical protein ACFQFQ_25335 [Sulfitobacter porphyrae]|uniref:Uncharacterized protein n=1 Tax=Sulfitobacter porphyrae TaxID=1246864 RepID=A0ABW2BBF4_9RHOB|nr:hypothetical protein GCM10007928_48270 [Sulfitobacter porphyrae]
MALSTDAMMVLFYDFDGDTADHDDWHSTQHFLERLLVPGFMRATRWVATTGTPRYLVTYEVGDTDVGTSAPYLARLNDPTPWTIEMMPRFRGMIRGFCKIVASYGLGLGATALTLRFTPPTDHLVAKLAESVLAEIAALPGVVSVLMLRPVAPPPMTREQSLRGADTPMPWLVLVTAHGPAPLEAVEIRYFDKARLRDLGASDDLVLSRYAMAHTAVAADAKRAQAHMSGL